MAAPRKLTKDQVAWAKSEYMNYKSVSEIARELGVHRTAIQYYVNEGWKSERILRRNELASELTESKAAIMSSTFSASYKGVHAWVQKVTDPAHNLSPHEVKTLMQIIESMDKITRLDAGSPTDIIADTQPIPVIEIRKKILESDPFLMEDADFKELPNEKPVEEDSKTSN